VYRETSVVEPRFSGARMRERLAGWRAALERPGVRKVAHNTFWLFADRVVRLGVGLLVGVAVARHLGPDRFGQFNYVVAFVTLFATTITAGTDSVVIRDLARAPGRADSVLAAAAVIRLVATPLVLLVVAVAALAAHARDGAMLTLIAVYAATLLFRPVDVVDLWFQAETNVRPTVWARNLAFFVTSAVKVGLLLAGASLLAFMAVEPLAAGLTAVFLLVAYRASGRRWTVAGATRDDLRRLMVAGAPLLLSGLAIVIYMRIDQVMLEHLAGGGAREVGLYSAAQRLSEVWYFLPMAVTSSVFPTLVRSRVADEAQYLTRLRRLFSVMALVALGLALATTLFSASLIRLVYGSGYAGAGPILSIHIWTAVFVFWGVVGETWYLNEGLTRLTLYRTGSAALANVALNLVLIPRYGGVGASVATLLSQAWSGWLSNLVWARTRPLFFLQLRSLSLRGLLG
jgi:polysaccharide transporter, PST family